MFRTRNMLVDFAPREGDDLEVVANVGLYEARGEFQLTAESMRRAGQGLLFEQFLRLKERLAAEGLFDQARKRPLPAVPSRIGVVTSLQAAALHDILTTLRRRAPYVQIIVYPVPVQGQGAAERIAHMLATVSARAEVEVVILARGGGSIEDLWAFNEEVVARAVRASAVPVIVPPQQSSRRRTAWACSKPCGKSRCGCSSWRVRCCARALKGSTTRCERSQHREPRFVPCKRDSIRCALGWRWFEATCSGRAPRVWRRLRSHCGRWTRAKWSVADMRWCEMNRTGW